MLDQAPVGIYESWSSGTFRSMNHEMARILGFSNADDALLHYHSIGAQLYVDPERRAHLIELLETEGRVRSFQIEAYRADGARMSLTTNAAVIERDPAQGLLIGGFVVDQTRQRRAERRLAQSREEYRSVVQLAREIIVRFDLEGKWSFLNNEACRFFGASREKLLGRRYLDYVHPDDRARTLQAAAELRARKRSVEGFENRQLTPEGWQLVKWNTSPILGESGECAGVQAIGRDVTEQHLMEERLRKSEDELRDAERKWRTLFEQATVGIFLVSRDHHIVEANPRAAELLGYSREELHTLSASDMVHPEDYAEVSPDETLRTMTREERVVETERRYRRRDGRYINALVAMTR
ncbi:MAG: PAS domain S-box protein, partial [Spirochaetota bacterium]